MALSDCINCWDTPCTCGWDYLPWSEDRLQKLIVTLSAVLAYKRQHKVAPDIRNISSDERAKIMKELNGVIM